MLESVAKKDENANQPKFYSSRMVTRKASGIVHRSKQKLTLMPLRQGKNIMQSMKRTYGGRKGEQVFYATRNAGKIKALKKQELKVGRLERLANQERLKRKAKVGVNEAGNYTKPGMRKRLFNRIKAGGKGGRPGQWSARKAQMLAQAYKKAGGGYKD